jgi:N-acetylglucosamine-6-phosphate deacetylase
MLTITAKRIFTGDEWLEDHVIQLKDGRIVAVLPKANMDTAVINFDECWLVPAFIDVQVYGAAGKLFSQFPEPETLQLMKDTFLEKGTVLCLPTIATNTKEVFKNAITAVRNYLEKGGQGIYGLHLEGPWLNPEKRGAHMAEWIHPPTIEEVNELLEFGRGVVKMITVAPEVCSPEIISLLLSEGIIVSAGHSNASYEQAMEAFDKGIPVITHLFNAMSPLQHRSPGLTGAAFMHPSVKASIIPDGHHVAFPVISIAKNQMKDRLFAITDAVTQTASGLYRHELSEDKYECNGVLSGSALTMHQAFLNLVNKAGISWEESLRMCSLYPAQVLGCDGQYGRIAPGYSGAIAVLDKDKQFQGMVSSAAVS